MRGAAQEWVIVGIATAILPLIAACDGRLDDDDDKVPDAQDHLDACTFSDDPLARVLVEEGHYWWESEESGWWEGDLSARIQSEPDPEFHALLWEEGACRVWGLRFGECEPECDHGELCTVHDECATIPTGVSGGAVTVEVPAGSYELEVWDNDPGRYYEVDELGELFDPGAPVSATIAGDVFPAVALQARGVQAMDEDLAHAWNLPFDDLQIDWTPGDDPDACVRVAILAPTAGHGGPYTGMIECVSEDAGSLTIPGSVLVLFPDGICPVMVGSDCSYSEITRYTRQTVETDMGNAELVVGSTAHFWYDHWYE